MPPSSQVAARHRGVHLFDRVNRVVLRVHGATTLVCSTTAIFTETCCRSTNAWHCGTATAARRIGLAEDIRTAPPSPEKASHESKQARPGLVLRWTMGEVLVGRASVHPGVDDPLLQA